MRPYSIDLSLLLIACSCLHPGCKETPTEPPSKDPRTYSWTVDTLAYPNSLQTIMDAIWGSSANNMYVVGHNDQARGLMWHFDGTNWSPVRLTVIDGGTITGSITLSAIQGFAASDIFAVGKRVFGSPGPIDTSLVIHFDGSQWRDISPNGGKWLTRIWGRSANDLWVGGIKSTFFHRSGNGWTRDTLPLGVPAGASLQVTSIAGDAISAYAFGLTTQSNPTRFTYSFFSRFGQSWSLVDTFVIDQPGSIDRWGSAGWVSPGGQLYSYSPGVFRWQGNQWAPFFMNSFSFRGMAGTSEQNVFLVGDFGKVYHYNGSDWFQFQNLSDENVVYTGVWFDGKEVFIVGFTASGFPNKTVIVRGR